MKKALAGLVLLLGTSVPPSGTWAGGVDLSLSDETANFAILLNPSTLPRSNGAELSVGGFVSEDDDRLAHLSLLVRGHRKFDSSFYNLAIGAKAIGGEITIDPDEVPEGGEDSERVGAVGLGFELGLLIRQSRYNPITFSVAGFHAPSITSFSEAERFTEISARLQIEVLPLASAYIGYRRMMFDTDDNEDVQLDQSAHIGLTFSY